MKFKNYLFMSYVHDVFVRRKEQSFTIIKLDTQLYKV